MELHEIPGHVAGFVNLPPREKIQIFAWFIHAHLKRDVITSADIRKCFADLHMADPGIATYLPRMETKKDLVKTKGGWKLEHSVRASLDAKYGIHHSVIQVSKLLADLPGKV